MGCGVELYPQQGSSVSPQEPWLVDVNTTHFLKCVSFVVRVKIVSFKRSMYLPLLLQVHIFFRRTDVKD